MQQLDSAGTRASGLLIGLEFLSSVQIDEHTVKYLGNFLTLTNRYN